MMKKDLIFGQLSGKEQNIEKRVLELVKENNDIVAEKLEKEIRECEEEEKLKMAFVGQHNSGKSTIISALTNDKTIKISSNVETNITEKYSWNDVLLYDTPGLYAGKKEEHDIIALEAIKNSDLLIYCITSSLFDDFILEKFMELAYKQGYRTKMVLLINKMSLEDGEYNELKGNYEKTLCEVIEKYGGNYEDFQKVFIDAKDYINGMKDEDDELIEFSNFYELIDVLNSIIIKKGLLAKIDTKCRVLIDFINKQLLETSSEIDKNMNIILTRMKRKVINYKRKMKEKIIGEENKLRVDILGEVRLLIDKIGYEEIGDNECNEINKKIEEYTSKTVQQIEEIIIETQNFMNDDIKEILETDRAEYVFDKIKNGKIDVSVGVQKDYTDLIEKYGVVSKAISAGGEKVVNLAGGAGNLAKLSNVSGSGLHNIVLDVGHFFGKSFKPWEAVKITNKIGKVANALGPLLSAVSVAIDVGEKVNEEKQIKEIKKCRDEIFNQFSSIIQDIIEEINSNYKKCEKLLFDDRVTDIDNIIEKMIKTCEINSKYKENLQECGNQLMKLIYRIDEENK